MHLISWTLQSGSEHWERHQGIEGTIWELGASSGKRGNHLETESTI